MKDSNYYDTQSGHAFGGVIKTGISNWNADEMADFNRYFRDAECLRGEVSQVNGKLGNGQNSVVFWGFQFGTNKAITIKVDLRPLDRAQNYDSIKEKINALKALHYPDIADLIAFIPDPHYRWSYILMEYVYGTDLNRILRNEGRIKPNVALDWGCEILRALDYLHSKDHIHGNIRASNIVRRSDGTVCLCDFSYHITDSSSTRKPGENNPDLPFNSGVSIFGTIQDRDRLREEQQNDLYWMGFLLYRLMTGRAFHDDESFEIQFNRLREVSNKTVAEVVLRAMGDRTERYRTANEMLNALYSLPYRDKRIKQGRAGFVTASYIASILIVAGFILNTVAQYKIDRVDVMRRAAENAQAAMSQADYTSALQYALDAVTPQSPLDPDCLPMSQKALTDALSTYDLMSGYKPFFSLGPEKLDGVVRDVRLSPKGSHIAVLENNFSAAVGLRIQILNAENGNTEYKVDTFSFCMEFLDEDSLLYNGREGLSVFHISSGQSSLISGSTSQFNAFGMGGFKIAVSDDRSTVATLSIEPGPNPAWIVHIYKRPVESDGKWQATTVDIPSEWSFDSLNPNNLNADDIFLVLNDKGTFLALNLPDGYIRVFALSEQGNLLASDEIHPTVPNGTTSGFTHFEGGFYNGYFFYTATRKQGDSIESVYALYKESLTYKDGIYKILAEIQETDPVYAEMHASVDKNGVFFSKGDSVWMFTSEELFCKPFLNQIDGTVTLLRHISGFDGADSGKILYVLDDNRIMLCGDRYNLSHDKTLISSDSTFNLVDLSVNNIVLSARDGEKLALLRWENPWNDRSDGMFSYDSSYSHVHYSVRNDETSAMLFRDTEPIFKIIYPDGRSEDTPSDILGMGILSMRYLRTGGTAEGPDEDCLEIRYWNGTVSYFSAKDGSVLDNTPEMIAPPPFTMPSIETDNYTIYSGLDQRVTITRKEKEAEKSLSINAVINDATEYGEYLVLSLIEDADVTKSLILDKDLECIAEVPGACMVLENGHLYFDDRQGHLIQSKIYTLEELRNKANERMRLLLGE